MAYTAWNVVFGEQPTAAKWNQLGQNDAGFRDGTNIDDNAILTRHLNNGAVTSDKIDWATLRNTFRALNNAQVDYGTGGGFYIDTTWANAPEGDLMFIYNGAIRPVSGAPGSIELQFTGSPTPTVQQKTVGVHGSDGDFNSGSYAHRSTVAIVKNWPGGNLGVRLRVSSESGNVRMGLSGDGRWGSQIVGYKALGAPAA